jgi:HK97 family phage portal protein
MKLREIFRRRSKAAVPAYAVGPGSGWSRLFSGRDHFSGAWQRDIRISEDQALSHHAVFAAMSLIASDMSKLRPRLETQSANGIWSETLGSPLAPVLSKPNNFQDIGQYVEHITWSKLGTGNSYSLKERDGRGVVVGLYPLDPRRVMPMVANDGSSAVFYQVNPDNMAGIRESVTVPAREIMHDRWNCIYHPLVGVSPLFAAMYAAAGGLAMVKSSANFFSRGQQLSGVLTAPGSIDPDTAKRLEDKWQEEFTGEANTGKIAVLGSSLKFEAMQMTMVDAQIAEQMKWSAIQICSVFHLPPYKIGLDVWPRGVVNVQALNVEYLVSCLQTIVQQLERSITGALNLSGQRVTLSEESLLRMDFASQIEALARAVTTAQMTPNEARRRLNLPPVLGGDAAYMQQQNFSLEALAKRDALANPFATSGPALPPPGAGA